MRVEGKTNIFFSKNGAIIIENISVYPPPNMYTLFLISIFSIALLLSNIFIYIDFTYAP